MSRYQRPDQQHYPVEGEHHRVSHQHRRYPCSSRRASSSPDLSLVIPQLCHHSRHSNGRCFNVQPLAATRSLVGVESPLFEQQPRLLSFNGNSDSRYNHALFSSNSHPSSFRLPSVVGARSVRFGDQVQQDEPSTTTTTEIHPNMRAARNMEVSVRDVVPLPQTMQPSSNQQERRSVSPSVSLHLPHTGHSFTSAYDRLVESFESQVSSRRLGLWCTTWNNHPQHHQDHPDFPYLLPSLSNVTPSAPSPPTFHLWQTGASPTSSLASTSTSSLSSSSSSSLSNHRSFMVSLSPLRPVVFPTEQLRAEPKGMALQDLRKVSIVGSFEGLVPAEVSSHGGLLKNCTTLATHAMMEESSHDCHHGFERRESEKEEEGDLKRTCTICCASFLPGEPVRAIYHCGHRYHVHCVDRWFEDNTTCPICRSDLKSRVSPETEGEETIRDEERRNPMPEAIERRQGDETSATREEQGLELDAAVSTRQEGTTGAVDAETAAVERIEHRQPGAPATEEHETTNMMEGEKSEKLENSEKSDLDESSVMSAEGRKEEQQQTEQQTKSASKGSSKLKFFFRKSVASDECRRNTVEQTQTRSTSKMERFFRSLSFK